MFLFIYVQYVFQVLVAGADNTTSAMLVLKNREPEVRRQTLLSLVRGGYDIRGDKGSWKIQGFALIRAVLLFFLFTKGKTYEFRSLNFFITAFFFCFRLKC